MLFNSLQFLIFFPIVVLGYFVIPKKVKYLWLLVASYYFYMCWNPKYALLILASTFITYFSGLAINRFHGIEDERRARRFKKGAVAVSFVLNLLILVFFKYFYFILDNINGILQLVGVQLIQPQFDIILPVGISFYTFQALSYTMDVYRKEVPAEKNFFRYALFVSFFPQLVAGPIERSKNLLSQLRVDHAFSYDRARRGLLLMLWGFFQKLVIADRAAILVNTVYNNHAAYGGVNLIFATVLFAVQIYCDFASYTDIARGAAQVLGFELMENFREPYFSKSIAEFWRRWHISLSSWFKDYLYIPLGGNKKGTVRKYVNIMIVFFTSGLWHGASWNFVVWGVLHGFYQIIGGATLKLRVRVLDWLKVNRNTHAHHFIQRMITFCLVCIGWVFFRANTLGDALSILKTMVFSFNPWMLTTGGLVEMGLDGANLIVLTVAILALFAVSVCGYYRVSLREKILSANIIVRWCIYFIVLFAVLIFGIYGPGYEASQFIYFQF